jgi:oligopeptidase A
MLRYDSSIVNNIIICRLLRYIIYQVSMATKMATVDKAEELLEKLRRASWDAAVQGSV